MLVATLIVAASAFVTDDWAMYRVGANDCRMRRVERISAMVMYGAADCTPKSSAHKMKAVALASFVERAGGERLFARVVSDDPLPASAPQAKLTRLFPGPTRLQVVRVSASGKEEVLAETIGSAREVLGIASDGHSAVVVYRYEKTVREPGEPATAVDVLGVKLDADSPAAR